MVPPAQQALARSLATPWQLAAFVLLACSDVPPTDAAFSTLFALTAYHCGANPWSEPAKVVGLPPMRLRASASFASASWYALRMYPSRVATRSAVPAPVHWTSSNFGVTSKHGFGCPFTVGVTSPMNWCENSSVTGYPTSARSV